MNKQLEDFARANILEGLLKLPLENQKFFNRMYSHKNMEATPEEAVRAMPVEKLDHAMTQIENTLSKGIAA